MSNLMWVSEWRIEKETDEFAKKLNLNYKITNGGVYSSASNMKEAKLSLRHEIEREMVNYIFGQIPCPSCNRTLASHNGYNDFRNCLENIYFGRTSGFVHLWSSKKGRKLPNIGMSI